MSPETARAVAESPFTALGLIPPIVRAVLEEGYSEPTPVQSEVVHRVLAGRDVLACAQTGTGKTAAFVLPILQHLSEDLGETGAPREDREIRVLVLTPTRELAAQIGESIRVYGRHLAVRHAVVYGGVSQHRQEIALAAEPQILVATPGRLLDFMHQRLVDLGGITHFVLDEADRMLDMGFVRDVRKIASALPAERQTLLFSATIPPSIEGLAESMLDLPARVSVAPAVTTAEGVEQSVIFVEKSGKRALLERILGDAEVVRAIVFTRTKHGANRLSRDLERAGFQCQAIHGNKSQGARETALAGFRAGTARVLVATDVAARGIDVDGISHVINYDLPNVAESYVHRIGRSGRAGAVGRAISLCGSEERPLLLDIERFIRRKLPVAGTAAPTEPGLAPPAPPAAPPLPPGESRGPRGRGGRRFR